jgi:hypothetical protein
MLSSWQVITCIVFLLTGCQKEELTSSNNQGASTLLTIEEARQYYDSNPKNYGSIQGKIDKEPTWDHAYSKSISNGLAVVIPLNSANTYLDIKSQSPGNSIGYIPFDQVNYLLMYKDEKMQIHSEWVTVLPDSAWLYGDRSRYQGKVLVRTWNGQPMKFFSYKDNEVTKSIMNDSKAAVARIQSEITEICVTVIVPCDRSRMSRENNILADVKNCTETTCETTGYDP